MVSKTYVMVVPWKLVKDFGGQRRPILPEVIDGLYWRGTKAIGAYRKNGLVKVEATYGEVKP